MKRKVASGIAFALLFIGMSTLAFNTRSAKAEPTTIIVPDDYEKIQWALGNATKGDTIFVRAGTYYERVTIYKSISLIGESKHNTTIDGGGTGNVVHVTADNVTISGFTVTNAELKGIQVENSRYCEVHENIVCFTGDRGIVFEHGGNNTAYNNVVYNSSVWYGGIEAIGSSNNTIYNNLAYFNQWGIATNHGSYNRIYNNTVYSNREHGIHMDWSSTGNVVYNNNVSSNIMWGISVINQARENIIRDNEISENKENGIWLHSSSNNTLTGNNIISNGNGVYVLESSDNTLSGNNITNNEHGIYLRYSSNNNITASNITANTAYGIDLYESSNNSIIGNHISNNDYGIKLELSSNNRFYHNNITENTNQVSITPGYANFWDYGYPSGGNYWSDYTGEDVDGDGIGDTPYVIDEDNQDNYPLGVFAKKAEPFPTLIVAVIVTIAVVGVVVIAYFIKFKK